MDPMTIGMTAAQFLPLLFGLFAGQKERDPTAVFNQLNSLLGSQFQPLLQAAMSLASREGARVGQEISGAVGAAGGGGTGIGAVSRSVGAGLASARADEARLNVEGMKMSALQALFPSFLNPGMAKPGALQNFGTALGLSQVGGVNPFVEFMKMFQKAPMTTAALKTGKKLPGMTPAPSFTLPVGLP